MPKHCQWGLLKCYLFVQLIMPALPIPSSLPSFFSHLSILCNYFWPLTINHISRVAHFAFEIREKRIKRASVLFKLPGTWCKVYNEDNPLNHTCNDKVDSRKMDFPKPPSSPGSNIYLENTLLLLGLTDSLVYTTYVA